jgi:putative addiction module antidote
MCQEEASVMQVLIPSPQKVRKVGNSLVVTIPADFAEQHNIKAEDVVRLAIEPVEQITISRLDPDLQAAVDEVLEMDHAALRYLGGHVTREE